MPPRRPPADPPPTPATAPLLPHVSVDCAVFGFHDGALKILLLKWKVVGRWSLPGGFVGRDEPVDRAAERVLRERTGLERIYLEQFHAFGDTDRGEGLAREFEAAVAQPGLIQSWMTERVVSIGYLALVDFARAVPTPDALSDECRWWDVGEHPALVFDHDRIVERARAALRDRSRYLPLGANLLPERFTLPELQRLYEAIEGRALDRRNFRKRMLEAGVVEQLPERKTGGAHRAPYLYRFRADALPDPA